MHDLMKDGDGDGDGDGSLVMDNIGRAMAGVIAKISTCTSAGPLNKTANMTGEPAG